MRKITRTTGAGALVVLAAFLASSGTHAGGAFRTLRPFADYEHTGVIVMSAADGYGAADIKRQILSNLPPGVSVVMYGDGNTDLARLRVLDDYGRFIDRERLRYVALPKAARGFWSRDAMPVPVFREDGRLMLIDARYWSGFEPDDEIGRLFVAPVQKHSLQFEGGNFAANHLGDCLVVHSRTTNKIKDAAFIAMYGCRLVLRLPKKGGIGHIDERVRFVNATTVVTDTAEYHASLLQLGLTVKTLPRPKGKYETYVNALFVNGTAFVPQYGRATDATALEVYRQLGFRTIGLDSRTLSAKGLGSLHCLVMNYPAISFDRSPG